MTTNTVAPKRTHNYAHSPDAGFYFQDGAWMTFFLTLVLYMTLAVSLNAARWVELSGEIYSAVTVAAVILAALMARSRFDGLFMVSHGIFTSLAWTLFQMTRLVPEEEIGTLLAREIPDLQARSYYVLLRWLDWIDAAAARVPSDDNLIFVLYISLLVFWLAYLGVWAIFRHGFVWRGVMPAGVALMVNTYYAPNPVVILLVIYCLVALILLVRANLAEQQLRWREHRIRFSPEVTYDFLRDGLLFSVLVVSLAWLAPTLSGNTQLRQILDPINETWEETSQEWNRLYQGINRQTRPVGGTFGRSLTLGGARDVTNSPVFQVDAPVGRYWRAVVFDTFTGRQWLNTSQEELTYDAGQPVVAAGWQMRRPITQTVTLVRPMGSVLLGAQEIRTANLAFTALVRPSVFFTEEAQGAIPPLDERPVELTLARSDEPLNGGDSYVLVSDYTDVTEWMLERAGTDYPDQIRETFLQLPENVDPRVVALAQDLTAPFDTPYAKTKAVERHLRNAYTYDDQIAAPAPDQDPVAYFLFDVQRGYCDYYATSMAVMLRSVGIPARTASGYAEGAYDERELVFTVTEADAHTWVEVFFPGLGWIEFEPTAGESVLDRPAGADPGAESAGTAATNPEQDRADLLPEEEFERGNLDDTLQNPDALTGQAGGPGLPLWAWILLTVAGVGLSGVLLVRMRRAGEESFTPDWAPILYERLQGWADRLNLSIRPGQTPYEHGKVLGHILPSGRTAISTIVDSYVRYRFSGRPDPGSDDAPVLEQESWQPLRPVLWKAWGRKVLGLPVAEEREGDKVGGEGVTR